MADQFNPTDHNVDEVVQYLKDTPDDRDRVITAERAGKGRKGILEAEFGDETPSGNPGYPGQVGVAPPG